MKKILFFLFATAMSLPCMSQGNYYTYNNFPEYYYREYWPDSSDVQMWYTHDNGDRCGMWYFTGPRFTYPTHPFLSCGVRWGIGTYPNGAMAKNFAIKLNPINSMSVSGIAILIDEYTLHRYVTRPGNIFDTVDLIDTIELQLLDVNFNVIASKKTSVLDTANINKFLLSGSNSDIGYHRYVNMYEAYFDEEFKVTNVFYVAAKTVYLTDTGNYAAGLPIKFLLEEHSYPNITADFVHQGFHWMAQGGPHATWDTTYTVPPGYGDFYDAPQIDTMPTDVWHDIDGLTHCGVPFIFPILNTDCIAPQEIDTTVYEGGSVKISWTPGRYDSRWQVSYGPAGTPPDSGIVRETTTPFIILNSLQYDTPYVAYVRALCTARDSVWSSWSDSLGFTLTPPGAGISRPCLPATTFSVNPNPAAGDVTVTFGDPLPEGCTLDLFGPDGRLLSSQPLPATATSLQLATKQYPTGIYLLRLSTPFSSSSRKLSIVR